jgi:hypothetical protein
MALSNAERIGKCLELLNQGLAPYVGRELKRGLGNDWFANVKSTLHDHQATGLKNDVPSPINSEIIIAIVKTSRANGSRSPSP